MDTSDFQEVERLAREQLIKAITKLNNTEGNAISDIQPTEAVVFAMAQAAAQVLIAFERGYQLSTDNNS